MTSLKDIASRPANRWKQMSAPFKGADTRRSVRQLTLTFLAFLLLWAAMLWSLQVSYFLTLALAFPTAGFVVRLFMIQHDCGHGSYFNSRKARDTVGFFLGILTLTPYHYWLKAHAYHHSHTGDLDFRVFGEIDTFTVKEYEAMPLRRRIAYRLYRNPFLLFFVGPFFQFAIKHRYPWDVPRTWKSAWRSVRLTNLSLILLILSVGYVVGFWNFLLVQVPVTYIACSIGLWLFYVQHQYENTYWHRHEEWDFFDAALHGSSHLVLPRPLQWLTAHIGLHHIHHLNSQIPNYKLPACLEANPDLQKAQRITIRDSFRLLNLALWDEENQRLISFRQMRQMRRQGA